ncbi:unnamed protein product [Brassica oleracea]|uniref:(rape) hypothetical protein n=1 Tax=Brassica napus TaxID=3708 RepID=A0A816K5L5_BRANA|nr:unnamed protein product [Brassica napus]
MHPHASRRDRTPRGPVPQSPNHNIAPPNTMLEIAASQPYITVHPPRFNSFVPDAQMLFHVLGICDQLMLTTTQFLRSSPSWLPIVSQLYISLLWNFTILRNFSLSSFNGRFFDITPIIPNFTSLWERFSVSYKSISNVKLYFFLQNRVKKKKWNGDENALNADYARQIPITAIILDSFTTSPPATTLTAFSFNEYNKLNRIGPQLCGSLFATPQQTAAARAFWSSVFASSTRVNAADETAPFTSGLNLFGFENSQTNWFQYTCIVMHNNYSKYFNASVPLSSILPTGLGAVAVRGLPSVSEATRSFLYPTDAEIEPFTSSRFHPRRQIPSAMSVTFQHCEYDGLGEEAERYAIIYTSFI